MDFAAQGKEGRISRMRKVSEIHIGEKVSWKTPQQWKGGVVIAKIPAGTPAKEAVPAGISPKSIKTRIDQPEYNRVIVQTERDGTIAYHIVREDKIAKKDIKTWGELLQSDLNTLAMVLDKAAQDGGCPWGIQPCSPAKPRDCVTCWRKWLNEPAEEEILDKEKTP